FFGRLTAPPDALSLFERLCEASPAPYSACLKLGDAAVLSSSPERFLTLDAQGRLETRPIKGSAPRHIDVAEDARLRAALAASAKDRAENLMIVDLMRNDFSRVCLPGSVQVSGLYDVSSFATIHHMASVVTGRVRPERGALDALCACFPPGSMTGAPKLRAMEIAARLEKMARGAYSGALGWFGGDGTMDLSVIIRTLIVQGGRFEFQVGGGVVADSTAEGEWRETMVKAEGIRRALGQEEGWLENI
ncbi:MAG: anthranilate synthase component I family protein, partial [Alphaproteobacteria bacterium]|nr:anthranilate synthase component I family protein [Alphaproteobacteria bacterium]